ncbi:carbamoylphosphate synthase large subunit short form, partial [bacterium]|nr:carbamoylphosphate synthase large subunit short form [bacterium]
MTRKQNVLVFPCGSEIGFELFRSLSSSTHVKLFGASSVSSNHGKYLYENYIEGLPYVDDPEFIDALNRIIDEHEIDFLFPAHDSVVLSFAVHQQKLNCKVIVSSVETCRICRS